MATSRPPISDEFRENLDEELKKLELYMQYSRAHMENTEYPSESFPSSIKLLMNKVMHPPDLSQDTVERKIEKTHFRLMDALDENRFHEPQEIDRHLPDYNRVRKLFKKTEKHHGLLHYGEIGRLLIKLTKGKPKRDAFYTQTKIDFEWGYNMVTMVKDSSRYLNKYPIFRELNMKIHEFGNDVKPRINQVMAVPEFRRFWREASFRRNLSFNGERPPTQHESMTVDPQQFQEYRNNTSRSSSDSSSASTESVIEEPIISDHGDEELNQMTEQIEIGGQSVSIDDDISLSSPTAHDQASSEQITRE